MAIIGNIPYFQTNPYVVQYSVKFCFIYACHGQVRIWFHLFLHLLCLVIPLWHRYLKTFLVTIKKLRPGFPLWPCGSGASHSQELVDCVQCQRCRLHAKLFSLGLGTVSGTDGIPLDHGHCDHCDHWTTTVVLQYQAMIFWDSEEWRL